jgi:hypothetical protein
MTMTDLGPATDRLCALIEAVPDADLRRATPCTEYTVGDLLNHIEAAPWPSAERRSKPRVNRRPWGPGAMRPSSTLTGAPRCPGA